MKPYFRSILCTVALAWLGLVSQAFAVSEAQYQSQMDQLVHPFYATGVDGSFRGKDGINIHYRKWENPSEVGAIVLLPGRIDSYVSFAETIYDLAQKGYSIYSMDHRGQGYSDRILTNPELGYVRRFDDYLVDAKIFVDTIVNARPHARRFLLAHSMGGAIAALYCYQFPEDFTAAALITPMFQINTAPFAAWEARVLAWWNVLIGKGTGYAPTQHDFDPAEKFENNKISLSEVRWQNYQNILRENPELQLGGATNLWVKESLKAGVRIHKYADQIDTPILLLTAGKDTVVAAPEQQYFCSHAKSCVAVPTYPDSLHNILAERDSIRDDALLQITQFFSEH